MTLDQGPVSTSLPALQELTQRQLLLWLGQQRFPDVPLYNMVVEFRIHGALDLEHFRTAFAWLVVNSDALRSTFCEYRGTTWRQVREDLRFELPFVDLSAAPNPELACREWADGRSRQLFDLGARCFDSGLARLASDDHVWWFCQHHLIGDGASVRLCYDFVAASYQDARPATPASAREALNQERAYLSSARHAADEAFWAARRTQTVEPLRLYAAPKAEAGRHLERMTITLDRDRSRRLRELALRHGMAALPDLAVAAWFQMLLLAYLARVTGRSEQALGVPLRNRASRAAKGAVGCFLEIAPVHVEVKSDDSFLSLFERLHAEVVSAFAHGQLCLGNSASRLLYDVTFNFHTERYAPFAGLRTEIAFSTGLHALPNLQTDPPSYWHGAEGFGFQCHDYGDQQRFTLYLDFSPTLADAEQRQRACAHFLALLEAGLSEPEARLDGVEIVDDQELALLERTNPTHFEDRGATTLVALFEAQAQRTPARTAVHFGNEQLSYADLDVRADSLARQLRQLGVGRESLVAVFVERSPDLLVTLLATLKAGGAYVPLDPSQPPDRNRLMIEDAAPLVIVTSAATRELVEFAHSAHVLCLGEVDVPPMSRARRHVPKPEDLAYVLFTSGSTGRPKGVAIEHGALANFLCAMQARPGIRADDRVFALTTISFDIAGLELFLPLIAGAAVDLLPRQAAEDPTLLRELLATRRPTLMQATPTTYQLLLDAGWTGDPSLRVLVGGEGLPPELARRLAPMVGELWNMYGPTETTIWSTLERVDLRREPLVCIGTPIANTTVHVLNPGMRHAPFGTVGEIFIGGAGLARGYHGQEGLTRERFVPDPFSSRPGARLYRTGDLGRRLRDGRLECLGRADTQVKVRGYRIELGEVEDALLNHPAVAAAAAIVSDDATGSKFLSAFVVPHRDVKVELEALRGFLRRRLPAYMVPSPISVLDALPVTASGKIDRKALAARGVSREVAPSSEPPTTELEQQIARIFESLLGVPVGRHDSFFDLGGHSVLAARLLVDLNALADGRLHFGAVFQHPTVAGLASLITSELFSSDTLVIPLNRVSQGTPLFCISGIQLYKELAEALGPGQPVYGVFVPAEEEGILSAQGGGMMIALEDLAQGYLEAIRKQQPEGPYCLAGVSFGGLLAYEIAQQLTRAGQEVAFVAMFDTILPRASRLSPLRWVASHMSAALEEGPEYVLRKGVRAVRRLRGKRASTPPPGQLGGGMIRLHARIAIYRQAIQRYDEVIQPYPGKVLLFRAGTPSEFGGYELDATLGWSGLASNLEVYQAEGNHLGLLQPPGVALLARTIRRELKQLKRSPA